MDQKRLLAAIGYDPVNMDKLISRTGMEINQLSAVLSQLELEKLIEVLPGGLYVRKAGLDMQ